MIIGVPKEIKKNEYRVPLTPPGVEALVSKGMRLLWKRMLAGEAGFQTILTRTWALTLFLSLIRSMKKVKLTLIIEQLQIIGV